ncbi:hypothetical protein Ahy_A07g036730 [Arachis hypogaea]|uniref:Transposase MuDR plant domain-containing protein n=1 Tax=Arachis hypogaea TaxID=3818 RepID=A0A445CGW5_ARAHY|nr:hypothetical protein Ahy_A07g036730 [Arachis hypogaea]
MLLIIPYTLSFEELKGVICEKIDPHLSKRVSCILYRYPLSVFGEFVQFQTKYITDEASMHEMFSIYIENRHRMSCIELYIKFEQLEADQNIELEDYDSDSEKEFESHYEIVSLGEEEDEADDTMNADVAEVTNVLENQQPFQEPSFMRSLDLEAMHAPEFPQYMNAAELPVVMDGEFTVGMEFSSREAVIKAMKDYTIRRGVDYRVYESVPTTFYAKCTQYGAGCDWLTRVTKMQKNYCWKIRRYNGSHTCTRSNISQDHSKIDSKTVAEAIKPLVEVDPYIKLHANQRAAGNIQVSCFDKENEVFEVREMPSGIEYAVDYADNVATVVNSKLTEFPVDMYLLVLQISGWNGRCTFMTFTKWTKFEGYTRPGSDHWEIQQHGHLIMDLDSLVIRS